MALNNAQGSIYFYSLIIQCTIFRTIYFFLYLKCWKNSKQIIELFPEMHSVWSLWAWSLKAAGQQESPASNCEQDQRAGILKQILFRRRGLAGSTSWESSDPSVCTTRCWRLSISLSFPVCFSLLLFTGASNTNRLNKLSFIGCKLNNLENVVEMRS